MLEIGSMLRKLALLSSLGLTFGCVVVADDDDTGNNDGPGDNAGDDGTGDDNTDNSDTPDTGGDDNTDPAGSDDPGDSDDAPADETAGESGGVSELCGWGPVMEEDITEGYICGGDGPEPADGFPHACPDIELEVGAECGDIEGQGCCAGDVLWFCSNPNDGGPLTLVSQDCAAG